MNEVQEIVVTLTKEIPEDFEGRVIFRGERHIYYYKNRSLHRTDGPAVIGGLFKNYCLSGEVYSKESWFYLLTEEQQIEALMNPENF